MDISEILKMKKKEFREKVSKLMESFNLNEDVSMVGLKISKL